MVAADAHSGLAAATKRWFQGEGRQRCRVRLDTQLSYRGAQSPPADGRSSVLDYLRSARCRGRRRRVGAGARPVRREFPKAGPLMDTAKTEVLAFTGFPRAL